VRLAVTATLTQLSLHFEDEAPPFDPRSMLSRADAQRALAAEQRPVGGLGLLMVADMAESFEYERSGQRNCLRVTLSRAS